MKDIANLQLAVDSRPVTKAEKNLKKLEQQGGRNEKSADQMGQAFKRLAGPLAAFLGTRQIIAAADSWTNMGNRLRIVTDNSQEMIEAQDAVFRIAQESRQPLDATAELYQRIATNQDALSLSGAGVAAVVDTINKAVAVSGTSSQAANAALVQLGQGFAAGTLRGQELNSVLEQAPALAKAIADGMGIAVGDLKELGESGSLTAKTVIDAITSQADAVDSQFGKINATVGQASTVISNSFTRMIGDLNDTTGATGDLADSMLGIAEFMDSGAFVNGLLESMTLWRASIDATTDTFGEMSDEMELAGDVGTRSIDFIISALKELPANVAAITKAMGVEFANGFAVITNHATLTVDTIKAIFNDDTVDGVYQRFQDAEAALKEVRKDSLQTIFDQREAVLSLGRTRVKEREDERAALATSRADREKEISRIRDGAKGGSKRVVVDKEGEEAAEKLLNLYNKTESSLIKQAELFDKTSEAAQLRYEIERGGLQGVGPLQAQRLVMLAEELDALTAQKEFADEVGRVLSESVPQAQQQIQDLKSDILILKVALDEGSITADQYAESVGHINEKISQVVKDNDEFGKQVEELGSDIDSTLLDGLSNAIGGVEDWEKQFLASIAKIIIQLVAMKAAQAFGTTDTIGQEAGYLGVGGGIVSGFLGGSGSAGGASSLLGNIGGFLGFKDAGGPIGAGQFAVVGERRPEIVAGPANIIGGAETAKMLNSNNGTKNTININYSGTGNRREDRRAAGQLGQDINRTISAAARMK